MSEIIFHDDRDTIIAGLRAQLQLAREELAVERARESGVEEGVAQLRSALAPLKEGLDRIFGILPTSTSLTTSSPAKSSAIWDSWKAKLPPGEGKAIDALLLHGRLKTDQIRIHIGCATRTATNIVSSLKSKGLVVKDGAHYSLKEL